ncbi:MAG: hypothetical protein ACOCYO_10005 [Bacteroidota bacterium]
MKLVITTIISLILSITTIGQPSKSLQFIDSVYNKPICGVMVFSNGKFLAVSDEVGTCRINDAITEIFCKYPGYKGRTLDIGNCDSCVFTLDINYKLLEEVEIKGKYKPKKHLLKLLKESQQTAYKLDTSIYYKFTEINEIIQTGQKEIFSGIIRVKNKGYSKKRHTIFISKISRYQNSIENDTYKQMQSSRIFEKFVIDVLYPRNIRRLRRNNYFQGGTHNTRDSLIFRVFTESNEISADADYLLFIKNKLRTRELARTFHRDTVHLKYYIKTDYTTSSITIPEYIMASREYILENGQLVSNTVKLQQIDDPIIEQELNVFMSYLSCQKLIKKAKEKYPDVEIPSEFVEE